MGNAIVEAVLKSAAHDCDVLKVREACDADGNPENDVGPRIREYQALADEPEATAWCADFVNFHIHAVPGTHWLEGTAAADTWAIRDWAQVHGCLYNATAAAHELPERGDVGLLMDSANEPEHTFFVTTPHADGTFDTIEGNTTDPTGVFPGKGVFRKTRKNVDCAFVRWKNLISA